MVMDRNNRSHRAKGLPQGVAGTYDATASAGGDDVRPPDAAPAPDADADAGRLWLDDVLRATAPRTNPDGTVADYRDEPVLQPAEEIRMVDRMAHGRILRGLKPWFPNEADASELAYRIASDRLMALRRSCAADPSKCYSPRLAQYALGRPVRMEAILSKPPYNLSAHRMRVGRRYLDRLREYRRAHDGHLPPESERDAIWDENMADFVNDKIARHVSYGGGMTYSDGRNANPDVKKRMRRDGDGNPLNGRADFETMLKAGRMELAAGRADFELAIQSSGATDAFSTGAAPRTEDADLHETWLLARRNGLDTGLLAERLGLDSGTVAGWESAYASAA